MNINLTASELEQYAVEGHNAFFNIAALSSHVDDVENAMSSRLSEVNYGLSSRINSLNDYADSLSSRIDEQAPFALVVNNGDTLNQATYVSLISANASNRRVVVSIPDLKAKFPASTSQGAVGGLLFAGVIATTSGMKKVRVEITSTRKVTITNSDL